MDRDSPSIETISSTQNQKVKNTILLQKPRERRKQNLFLVEGQKEVERAIHVGYIFKRLFICRELYKGGLISLSNNDVLKTQPSGAGPGSPTFSEGLGSSGPDSGSQTIRDGLKSKGTDWGLGHPDVESFFEQIPKQAHVDYVSPKVYAHMAYRGTTEGIIGWAVPKDHDLKNIQLSDNPLILVVDAVEKPGNLGAILRTADATGIDALIISDSRTDVYNPNVIRSSLGAVFSTQVGVEESGVVIEWLKKNKIKIFCTALTASRPYTEINYSVPSAIVMGSEATGLSESWLNESDQNIIIPMKGIVDSMNVSVSTGIVLFEAIRQRKIG
jgi:TrmH family RNA methyltransferase